MNPALRLLTFSSTLLFTSTIPSKAGGPTVAGIPNFHQVTERIYRGAQPAEGSWHQLAELGVKTVVDLRRPLEHSTVAESMAVHAAGMRYVNFPMDGFQTPTTSQMATVLGLLDGSDNVFVHCKQGRDRTGSVIAAYRISRQGWDNRRALAEAQTLGMHWYEAGMRRFIAGYRGAPDVDPVADATVAATTEPTAVDSTTAETESVR